MGLFGGVQVANILCSIVKTKLIALWIGPAGIGLFSLFSNAVDMIYSAASLGIRNSSVRDVAIACESRDGERIGRIVAVVKKWAWLTSILGAVVMIALAPVLSKFTFGDSSHMWDFVLLSCVLLFFGLANGEQAILQGSSMMRRLADASLWGVFVGLAVSVPLYYFLMEDSIVISIIVYNVAIWFFTYIFRFRDYSPVKVKVKEAMAEGREFVRLGIFLTVSGFVTILFSYAFSAYLNRVSGTDEVGFFQAGFTIVNRYVELIFSAIGMEYYPRLARICGSRIRTRVFVSQEINVAMLVLIPVVSVFLLLREFVVSILYTGEFHVIVPYISWAIVGTAFRAYSWCLAFVVLAKGDGKTYLFMELTSAALGFLLNVAFYEQWGLMGLGVSYIVWYFAYCIITGVVYFRRYGMSVSGNATFISVAAVAVFLALLLLVENGYYAVAIIVTALISAICLYRLKRLYS